MPQPGNSQLLQNNWKAQHYKSESCETAKAILAGEILRREQFELNLTQMCSLARLLSRSLSLIVKQSGLANRDASNTMDSPRISEKLQRFRTLFLCVLGQDPEEKLGYHSPLRGLGHQKSENPRRKGRWVPALRALFGLRRTFLILRSWCPELLLVAAVVTVLPMCSRPGETMYQQRDNIFHSWKQEWCASCYVFSTASSTLTT